MRLVRRMLWFVILVIPLAAAGQYTKEFKRIFHDADYMFQTGFYGEAFSRYKNLLTLDPGNSNILFHCGACCLELPGNEEQAVVYLQEAANGVNLSYKNRSPQEPGAPVLAYYKLGRAYHLNNEFDKAIENYKLYRGAADDEDPMQVDYAGIQIEACRRAAVVVADAPSFDFQSVLDHFDDELPSCNNPVISGDGNILIFLVDYPNDKKIMMTVRTGKLWSRPRVINSEIGMVGETFPVCLSYDGKDLYMVHKYYSHSDIFISRFEDGRWTEAEALGSNVNGRTSEIHASVSKDGTTLYFVSDARGGEGSYDIFVSRLNDKGEWGASSNLGPVINTIYEEHTPFISSNDSILFFSSQGHSSIGGIDVFYSELGTDGNWMEPLNMGYPVNTTADNVFFNPGWDEMEGYYAVRRDDDPTSNTINMVIELEPEEQLSESLKEEVEPPAAEPPAAEPPAVKNTVAMAIEPEETDEIHEVLNKGVEKEESVGAVPIVVPVALAGATRFRTSIPFDHNAYELTLAALLEVEKVAEVMQSYVDTRILITGHADATGSSEYNLLLSNQRAVQIVDYLEGRGIDRRRLSIEAKGEHAPVARNVYPDGSDAPLGRYLNRHVSLIIESPEPIVLELSGFYVPARLRISSGDQGEDSTSYWYTIQVLARQSPVETSFFEKMEGVREYVCKDNYYRYACGKYGSMEEARSSLVKIKASGYPDAFIQTLEWYAREGS